MENDTELFDPDFLGRLRTMFFKLRKRRQLKKKGLQNTHVSGFTREFKDYRQYSPGDDYRSIDWKLYARLERMFIRIYEEVQDAKESHSYGGRGAREDGAEFIGKVNAFLREKRIDRLAQRAQAEL